MNIRKGKLIILARSAIVAALYFTLTYAVNPIAFGPIQFRPGEALTLLPIIFPESIVGVTLGCLLANVLSPYGWYDMLFGTMATLIASLMTYVIGINLRMVKISVRAFFGAIPPIVVNALILPLIWLFFSGDKLYVLNFVTILGTQAAVIYLLGMPLVITLSKIKILQLDNVKRLNTRV
ncbi:MAG: QueT transporter family protein [Christensenellaceae bacterium]|nr:QueT transporter family protein [Christensenellaceae bacterium]